MKKQTRTKTAMKLSAMIVSAFMMLAACTETVQKQMIPTQKWEIQKKKRHTGNFCWIKVIQLI